MVGQEADLKVLNQTPHLLFVQQQCGNGNEGGAIFRNFFGEVQLRQNLGAQESRRQIIHQLHRALRGRQQQNNHGEQDEERRRVGAGEDQHNGRHDPECEYFDAGQIELVRMALQESAHALDERRPEPDAAL